LSRNSSRAFHLIIPEGVARSLKKKNKKRDEGWMISDDDGISKLPMSIP
jgi:hypothetical protein